MPKADSRFSVIIILGALAVALGGLFFRTAVESPNRVQTTAFGFLIAALIVTAALPACVEKSRNHLGSALFRAGIYGALGVYLPLSLVTAALFIFKVAENIGWLIRLELTYLGLLAGAGVILAAAAASNAAGRGGEKLGRAKRGGF